MTNHAETDTLLSLIQQQLGIAESLETLLMAEYTALLASDLPALSELVRQKRQAAEALEHSSLALAEHTQHAPEQAVALAGAQALQHWQQLAQQADRLRQQNLANGALLNERQNRLRWVAERARREPPALYSPRPTTSPMAGLGGHSLARA